METNQVTEINATNHAAATMPKAKAHKRRNIQLTPEQSAGFPNAMVEVLKKAEVDLYFITCYILVTGSIGTVAAGTQVLMFAADLDEQAKANGVGEVALIAFADGVAEIVLKLTTTGEQSDYGAPARNAFTQLNDYFNAAPQLKAGPDGRLATWKAKVNGTTIVNGHF